MGWRDLLQSIRSGCQHANVAESKRHDDGSIDGRCADCGEDGFPIRDVQYEQWVEQEGEYECSLLRMARYGEDYPTALRKALANAAKGRRP